MLPLPTSRVPRAAGFDVSDGVPFDFAMDAVIERHAVVVAGLGETDEVAHMIGGKPAVQVEMDVAEVGGDDRLIADGPAFVVGEGDLIP